MIEPPKPSRLEIIYRRASLVCWLLLASILITEFVVLDKVSNAVSFLILLSLFLAAFIVVGAIIFMKKKVSKLRQERRDVYALLLFNAARSGDLDKFALFLRPFYVTGKIIEVVYSSDSKSSTTYELEQTIVKSLGKLMPTVALGKPGEAIGVGRLLTDEKTWKSAAAVLMRRASLIISVPSSRPGSAWELEEIIRNGYFAKTIFLMPPEINYSPYSVREDWDRLVELMKGHGIAVPDYQKGGLLFSVKPQGGYIEEDLFGPSWMPRLWSRGRFQARVPKFLLDAVRRVSSDAGMSLN
jgi:hypothetical protein